MTQSPHDTEASFSDHCCPPVAFQRTTDSYLRQLSTDDRVLLVGEQRWQHEQVSALRNPPFRLDHAYIGEPLSPSSQPEQFVAPRWSHYFEHLEPHALTSAVALHTLQYLTPVALIHFLQTLHRRMKPRGQLLVSLPSLDSPLAMLYPHADAPLTERFSPLSEFMAYRTDCKAPVALYTIGEFKSLVRTAHWSVVEEGTTERRDFLLVLQSFSV